MKKVSKMFTDGVRFFNYSVDYFMFKNKLASFLGVNSQIVKKLYKKLYSSDFHRQLKDKSGLKEGFFDFSMLNPTRGPLLYLICRLLRPKVIVETGVSDGFSSSFILKALEENNQGKLYSIDFPNQPGHENRNQSGWLIPLDLRPRWELIIGDSKQKLPDLIERLKTIDIFSHDSDHSYNHVLFELNTVWPVIAQKGIVLVDDIHMSKAYHDFCLEKGAKDRMIYKLGIGIKGDISPKIKQESLKECNAVK